MQSRIARSHFARTVAVIGTVLIVSSGCYSRHTITTDELEKLESGQIAERVEVEADDGVVTVRATTPIQVLTADGGHNISPFNFSLSDTQLVAPDYDLLLPRDAVEGARVSEFAKGKTIGLIVGAVLIAGGGFAAVSILAGSDRGLGEN